MAKPTLAIDVDEVLAQHNASIADWHNKQFNTQLTEQSFFTDLWQFVWGVDALDAEYRARMFHASGAHANMLPVAGAYDALKTLEPHFKLVIVSVRRECVIDDTYSWLDKHFPDLFSDVRFIHFWDKANKATKASVCKKIGASYLVDDSLKHCTQAADAGVNAILFGNHSWNQATSLPTGVTRAANWQEAVALLINSHPKAH